MANQWFKFYGAEYLSDPKMDRLSVQERSCWLTLLCMASQSDGMIKFLSLEGLLAKSGISFNPYDSTEWDEAQNVLHNFQKYEMIEVSSMGVVKILNWEKRQEHNLTVNERVAKHRAKSKALVSNVTTNVTYVTSEENRIEENRIEENTFSSFWESYPNKTNKKKTQDLWESKKLNTKLEEILLFLEKANNTDRWKKGFIKAPDVFLRNESWNDDISAYGGGNKNEVYQNKSKVDYAEKLKAKMKQK